MVRLVRWICLGLFFVGLCGLLGCSKEDTAVPSPIPLLETIITAQPPQPTLQTQAASTPIMPTATQPVPGIGNDHREAVSPTPETPTTLSPTALLATQEASFPAHYTTVAVQGDRAYVSYGKRLIVLHNVFEPNQMYSGRTHTFLNQINDVQIIGDYIYTALGTPGNTLYTGPTISEKLDTGLQIINVAAFSDSLPSTEFATSGFYNTHFNVFNLTVLDNVAYLVSNFTWEIVDVSDIANPTQIPLDLQYVHEVFHYGRFEVADGYRYWFDHTCYRAACYGTVKIYDTSNPLEFSDLGRYESNKEYLDIAVRGDYAYLVSRNSLQILDISDQSQPVEVSTTISLGGQQLALIDHFAYIISNGLQIVDIADPVNPQLVLSLFPDTHLTDIVIENEHVFIVDWDTGLYIFDGSDPANPVEVNHFHRRGGW